MKIIVNQAKCKLCGDLVISRDEEIYQYCTCGAIGVAGGQKAILRLGHHSDMIELSQKNYK